MKEPERRKQKRHYVANAVEYVVASSTTDEILDGVIADINNTGLCLLTTDSLRKEQQITIKKSTLTSPKKAIVRWSNKCLGLYYRSGVEFIQ